MKYKLPPQKRFFSTRCIRKTL